VKRIVSSALLAFFTWIILFFLPSYFFVLWVILFVVIGCAEFANLISRKGIFVHKYIAILTATALCLPFFFTQQLFILYISLLSLFLIQFTCRDRQIAIFSIATTFLGIIYVGWLGSFWSKLIFLEKGKYWVLFLLLVCKGGDGGAYLLGKRFGKHRLIPRISPYKSREGAVAGLLCSILIALLSNLFFLKLSYLHSLLLGGICGVLGQIGDLAESLLKRDAEVKDSGRVFSGLGGSLDLIDSLLFTAPVVYFYLIKIVGIGI